MWRNLPPEIQHTLAGLAWAIWWALIGRSLYHADLVRKMTVATALDLAFELATRPGFDCLHDPNTATALIEPYHDPVGYPTIGYGRLLSRIPWEPLDKYQPITPEQAKEMVMEDLAKALAAVRRLCPVPLEDHQLAALADFTFNAGAGNLQISALRQCVLRGDHEEAASQFGRWVYTRGVKLPGLVKRRKAEEELYIAQLGKHSARCN